MDLIGIVGKSTLMTSKANRSYLEVILYTPTIKTTSQTDNQGKESGIRVTFFDNVERLSELLKAGTRAQIIVQDLRAQPYVNNEGIPSVGFSAVGLGFIYLPINNGGNTNGGGGNNYNRNNQGNQNNQYQQPVQQQQYQQPVQQQQYQQPVQQQQYQQPVQQQQYQQPVQQQQYQQPVQQQQQQPVQQQETGGHEEQPQEMDRIMSFLKNINPN